jgi:hypothetical protein
MTLKAGIMVSQAGRAGSSLLQVASACTSPWLLSLACAKPPSLDRERWGEKRDRKDYSSLGGPRKTEARWYQ